MVCMDLTDHKNIRRPLVVRQLWEEAYGYAKYTAKLIKNLGFGMKMRKYRMTKKFTPQRCWKWMNSIQCLNDQLQSYSSGSTTVCHELWRLIKGSWQIPGVHRMSFESGQGLNLRTTFGNPRATPRQSSHSNKMFKSTSSMTGSQNYLIAINWLKAKWKSNCFSWPIHFKLFFIILCF